VKKGGMAGNRQRGGIILASRLEESEFAYPKGVMEWMDGVTTARTFFGDTSSVRIGVCGKGKDDL